MTTARDGAPRPLETVRLRLVPLEPLAIRALLEEEWAAASVAQGVEIREGDGRAIDPFFLGVQYERMLRHPAAREWCARLMVRRVDRQVIGHCGFHGPPEDVGRAEIGYTVFERYRGQRYATEAARALLDLASSRGVSPVFATVAPDNAPSLRVLANLGFVETGSQHDERDGEELVFEYATVT